MIGVINYGLGNLGSVLRAFERLGTPARIVSTKEDIIESDKLILPGVGHAGEGMKKLNELGFVEILNKKVLKERTPILGLCLGMQLMARHSAEGNTTCLGWFNVEVKKFPYDGGAQFDVLPPLERRTPHMGWNTLQRKRGHPLLEKLSEDASFYFAHSYYVDACENGDTIGGTTYQLPFASAIARDNIMGVQFHPERSHKDGLQLLKNFAELSP